MDEKWRGWYKSTLQPLLEYKHNTQETLSLQGLIDRDPTEVDLALLAADTDRTQDYVFESAKLPEIRGGSELLRKLNEESIPRILSSAGLPPECVLYAAGGSLLAIVPASIALSLIESIENLYPDETVTATISCVSQKVTPKQLLYGLNRGELFLQNLNDLKDKLQPEDWDRILLSYASTKNGIIAEHSFKQEQGFGQIVQVMGNLLRQHKDSPLVKPNVETLPFAMRCRVCQIRPAEFMHRYFEEDIWPICNACRQRVKPGIGGARETRSEQLNRFLSELKNNRKELETFYLDGVSPTRPHHPQDLGELGEVCRLQTGNSYVGFIYADGNRMGRVLESLPTPQTYSQFSQALSTALQNAAYQALAENLHPTLIDRVSPTNRPLGRGYIHPLEPLVIGGDDIMLIVPGHTALSIAARLCQYFEQEMDRLVPDEIKSINLGAFTISTGVVIAHSHNPVRVLQQLSKELCKIAKGRAHDEEGRGQPTSTLDFMLLKSQSMLRRNVRQLRQTPPYFYTDGSEIGRILTGAPYTLEEFCRILYLLKTMRRDNFPISQLRNIVAPLHKGRSIGSIQFLYQQARSGSSSRVQQEKNLLTKITKIWPYTQWDPIPWHQAPDREMGIFASILPDLLELYPLVPRFTGLPQKAQELALSKLWQPILAENFYED